MKQPRAIKDRFVKIAAPIIRDALYCETVNHPERIAARIYQATRRLRARRAQ